MRKRDIVGSLINGQHITNSKEALIAALENDIPVRLLDRAEMQFMAACDLGPNWEGMATGPTLLKLDEEGNPYR